MLRFPHAHRREEAIVRIEQYGPEACSTPPNSSFVLVDVPLHVVGDGVRGEAEYRYRIGTFLGRMVDWPMEQSEQLVIRLRIPAEKFRPGEDLSLEVMDKRSGTVLWKKGWKAAWQGNAPAVESAEEGERSEREWSVRARRYRSGD